MAASDRPKVARAATPLAPDSESDPELEGMLAAEAEELELERTPEARDVEMIDAAAGDQVTETQHDERETAMVASARGEQVQAFTYVEDGYEQDANTRRRPAGWNGIPTRFQLGFPLMHNVGNLLGEDDWVIFNVHPVLDPDGHMTGRFIGTGEPIGSPDQDQGEHVEYLYNIGMFKGTAPYRERVGKQAAVDFERGAFGARRIVGADESGNPIFQEALKSVGQRTRQQVEDQLRRDRGWGTAKSLQIAERAAAMAGSEAPGTRSATGHRQR